MRNKKCMAVLLAAVLALAFSLTAFAGSWESDETGWRWQNDDGSYPVNSWQWLDGNNDGIAECYYFNESGYMLANTVTPDGYTVDGNGAWAVDGVVQTQAVNMPATIETQSGSISGTYVSADNFLYNGMTLPKDITYYKIQEQADGSLVLECDGLTMAYNKVGDNTYEAVCYDNPSGVDRLIFNGNTMTDVCTTYSMETVFTKQ